MHREYLIRLSWPAPPLWENRRVHWAERASAKAAARAEAKIMAQHVGIRQPYPTATLEFAFYPPPRSRPDMQNMPATMKAQIDGIADAMGCDDRHFKCVWPTEFCERVDGGAVLVTVKP